jgi:uncharacterized protein
MTRETVNIAFYGARLLGVSHDGPIRGVITAGFAGPPILSLGYMAALILLFARRANRFQAVVAPAGRMALTNYLASGLIGSTYFFGFGFGQLSQSGVAAMALFATAVYFSLLLFSHLWLTRFRIGPCEWLWRSLIERRRQPILRFHRDQAVL